MPNNYRIAVGGYLMECNHLCGRPTTIEDFQRGQLRFGAEALLLTNGSTAGILEELGPHDVDSVPLFIAEACPGGPLTAQCYEYLRSNFLDRLEAALPVDAVLLGLHGSSAAQGEDDPEGDLLEAIREMVGENVVIGAALDTHANVTARMVANADILAAYETYPHLDAPATGARVTRLVLQTLEGEIQPVMALAKVPVLVSGVLGHTQAPGPFAEVMNLAKEMEHGAGVLSASAFLVHPYLDVAKMGGGGLVITNGDSDKAVTLASCIARAHWERRERYEPIIHTPAEAIDLGLKIEGGPVILAEVADCSGGGACGDSVHTLHALLEAKIAERSLVPVVDAEAALLCSRAGEGAEIELDLGHKLDPKFGAPLRVNGRVRRVSDGSFRYEGGAYAGQIGEMGLSVLLEIGAIQVLITSHATYDWADEQFRAFGLEAGSAKFLVAKNPMNYSLAYRDFSKGAFILDTAGPTPATLRGVRHHKRERPYYPADIDVPDIEPTVCIAPGRHGASKTMPIHYSISKERV